jgi:hypothetical protein
MQMKLGYEVLFGTGNSAIIGTSRICGRADTSNDVEIATRSAISLLRRPSARTSRRHGNCDLALPVWMVPHDFVERITEMGIIAKIPNSDGGRLTSSH